jgi:hypothetical protein
VVDQGNHRINVFKSDGTFLNSFGSAQLKAPTWVAVDNDKASSSQHDVYVSADDFEVQKFTPAGEFLGSFGGEGKGACQLMGTEDPVAVGPKGDVFVADSYDKDGAGELHVFVNRVQRFDSEGKCVSEVPLFEGQSETIRDLAVDSLGDFYVSVAGAGGVIRKYGPAGTLMADLGGQQTEGLSVDVADNVFAKQRRDGSSRYFIAEYAPDNSLVKRFGYLSGLAAGTSLAALEAEGSPEGAFATEKYFVPAVTTQVNFLPIPKGPVIVPEPCHVKNGEPGSIRATIQAEVNPEGKATTVKVEYTGGSETKTSPPEALGGEADFELHEADVTLEGLTPETTYSCRVIAENPEGTTPPGEEGSFETKEGFAFGGATVSEVGEEEATLSAEGNPLGLPATAQIEYVTDAKFNEGESRFANAQVAPAVLDYGAGEAMQSRSTTLTGLTPATIYHWRLHVKNGVPPAGIVCPRNQPEPCPANEHLFRTYGAEERADERAWELVSPGQKSSAEVAMPALATGVYEDRFQLISAASGSGEAATFTSFTSFGKDAEGAPSASQYYSHRTPGGWVTENISPFGFQEPILSIPFKGFTPGLGFAVFKVTRGVLSPGCPEGVENLYLRDNASGSLTCLTAEVPQEGTTSCFDYAGSSEDGSRVFLASGARYAGVPAGHGFSLYEWTAEGGLKPLSILPGQSTAAVPTGGTTFGPSLGPEIISNCQFGQTTIRHAVSADGSKAFWTYVSEAYTSLPEPPGVQELTIAGAGTGTFTLTFQAQVSQPISLNADAATIQKALEALSSVGPGNVEVSGTNPFIITFKGALAGTSIPILANTQAPTQLLARINNTETVQLDAEPAGQKKEKPGSVPFGNGVFQAASKDGSVVYFTDTGRLISGSKAEEGKPDLYRYEFGKSEPLSDLTKGAVPGNVQGILGASDDGSYLYFVAKGVLSGEEEGPSGEKAIEGANNLYLYHAGKASFIARLAGEDLNDWGAQPKNLSARVTPDGKHLAFLSLESQALAGYDNTIAQGQHCEYKKGENLLGGPLCTQGFLYDAEANTLDCATCNPTGARPLGPAALPTWSNPFEGPRYLSDDGNRFFFESFDPLLKEDENEKLDVYEFERPGTGSCATESGAYDPASGGCHYLVSTGKSKDQSYLVDASSGGRDVFFATSQALVGWDPNENYDVYDYRDGGGFPEPAQPQVCVGEGCIPPVSAPPSFSSPPRFEEASAPRKKPKRPSRHKKHSKAKKKAHHHKKGARR